MRRILFTCFGFNVYSYPAMLYLGLVAGVLTGAWIGSRDGLDPDRVALAGVILFVPGLVGARLLYVAMHWEVYAGDVRRVWRRREGGMAMYGGFVLAFLLSYPLLRALDLPFAKFWDAGTFTILIVMLFARIGCLLNGCCEGAPTDGRWGLNLPDHRGEWRRRFPSQILEMAWAALLLTALFSVRGRMPFSGAVFYVGVGAYGIGRVFLQRLRADHGGRETDVLQKTSILLIFSAIFAALATWILVAAFQRQV